MSDDPYLYPGTSILKNKLGITDRQTLDAAERRFVYLRSSEGIPGGQFDGEHLREIHRHLFQDVYAWAGQLRTVEMAKDESIFQFAKYIDRGLGDISRRLKAQGLLQNLPAKVFAREAGKVVGDLNYVHPFREGNGRTQLIFLKQLGAQAGHEVDLSRIDPEQWLRASVEAHQAHYELMGKCIERACVERIIEHTR